VRLDSSNHPDVTTEGEGSPFGEGSPVYRKRFSTAGRRDTQALLMINVRGLTDGSATVIINNKIVKSLQPCPQGNSGQWFSQHMVLQSDLLDPSSKDGQNVIEIKRVLETGNGGGGQFDDFIVRDIVCFFHQAS
jgi:hypothetical protein